MSLPHFGLGEHYPRRWARFWGLVSAAGVALAIHEWSPLVVVAGVALDSTCLAVVYTLLQTGSDPAHLDRTPGWAGRRGRRSLLVVSGVVTVLALATVSLPLALATLLAAVLTSPVVVRRRRGGPLQTIRLREPRDNDHFHV